MFNIFHYLVRSFPFGINTSANDKKGLKLTILFCFIREATFLSVFKTKIKEYSGFNAKIKEYSGLKGGGGYTILPSYFSAHMHLHTQRFHQNVQKPCGDGRVAKQQV